MNSKPSFYLPALDGLRFFAFFLVFMHHFPQAPQNSLLRPLTYHFNQFGWIGVDLFLCLSAYLLTSLILIEYQTTHHFNIKHFFIRRSLRIWPLYYGILFLAFFLFPILTRLFHWSFLFSSSWLKSTHIGLLKIHLLPYLAFLGNFSYAYSPPPSLWLAPLWTLSLEEQFYIFCPVLFYILLPKQRKYLFFLTIIGFAVAFLSRIYIEINHLAYPTIWTFTLGRIDPLFMGCVLAFLHQTKNKTLLSGNKSLLLFFILVSTYLLLADYFNLGILVLTTPISILTLFLTALISILLIHATINIRALSWFFSAKPLRFLGKISFGLYVYHIICIQLIDRTLCIQKASSTWIWLVYLCLALSLSILLSSLSYFFFERRFLLLKGKYTRIPSRPV